MPQTYEARPYEVRIIVHRQDGAYRAEWIEPDGQRSEPFSLVLPLTAADAADLRWYLEEFVQFPGAGDRARARGIEGKLEGWGHALSDALFGTTEGVQVYNNLKAAARRGERCLLTLGATDPELLVQPWEMMRDRRGPLTFQGVTLRRQLVGAGQARRFELGLPLRVLLIVSRPVDAGFIDPRVSTPAVLDALDDLPPGQVVVDFCEPPTFPRLEEMVSAARKQEQPYHLVHFDGHGTYLPLTGVGALCFEDGEAHTDLVTARRLGDLLARLEVPLVLLEACRGASLSDRPVFGSVAPALLESGVGSVLAFSHAVHVEAARLLVERLYRELCAGLSVGQALEEARLALHARPARWLHLGPNAETIDVHDWFIPQLYQVGADPVLLSPAAGQVAPPQEKVEAAPFHNFPPPPLYRFHGRALELLELERAFRRHAAVAVSGMGGMGKTALAREAAAWWLRKGSFEAAVFVSFEQAGGAERVVQLLGEAVEGAEFHSRPAAEQRQAAVELFHRRRILLVWDNFESTLPAFQQEGAPVPGAAMLAAPTPFSDEARAQIQRLYRDLTQPDAQSSTLPASCLLVTCRPADTGLPGIKAFPLEGLARPDSLYLLAAVLDLKGIRVDGESGQARPGYERAEIDRLLDALADHPLSVELVAPHLKERTPAQIVADYDGLLARFAAGDAIEARNRSLLASLEFSRRHLSPEAQQVLPSLGWFEGGVFERFLLDFAGLASEAWAPLRAELVNTALLSVEELPGFNTPYLRFHPTLPYAARRSQTSDVSETSEVLEKRFIGVYLGVAQMAYDALRGRQPAAGMALLAREEANLRAAMTRAIARGEREAGVAMADTLGVYLPMAGRLRERDALAEWVRAQMPPAERLDEPACAAIRQHAWSLFGQGRATEALEQVQALLARLEAEGLAGGEDPTFQIALGYSYLGRIYVEARRPDLALEPLQKAIAAYEQLGDAQRGNLSAALGDLANTYRALGRLDPALEAAERSLAIRRELGHDRDMAAALGQIANILAEQQRYAEAEARYGEALRAAQAAGDLGLQGVLLAHQGILQRHRGHHDRAVELYRQAIALFQRAGDPGAEMRTCDLLASAERERGHLDAAEAWYARSRELAIRLEDRFHFVGVARNLGILYQDKAEQATDLSVRDAFLRQAVTFVQESLDGFVELNERVNAAASYGQLGILYRMLGDLSKAEENTLQALEIHESLNLPDVYKDYGNLADIARDLGDAAAAARWQAKHDAKLAEMERLRRGEGTEAGEQARQAGLKQVAGLVLALAQTAYAARTGGGPLPPDAAEALAQLAELPPPLGEVGPFLQAVAAGEAVPAVPAGLPAELAQILEALVEALAK